MYRCLIALMLTSLWIAPARGQGGGGASFESSGEAVGMGFLKPEHWGLIRSRIRNSGSEPVELLSSVEFKHSDHIQFVTKAWVPSQSVRDVVQPVYLSSAPQSAAAVDIQSLLIDTTRGEQRRDKKDGLIRLDNDKQLMCMVGGPDSEDAISAVIAARLACNAPKRLAYVVAENLPAIPAAYGSIAAMAIAHHQIDLSPAQLAALRAWLVDGGRLWLMLDRLPSDFAPRLLGNDWPVAIVDRLPMTQLVLTGPGGPVQREREVPWDMLRVIASDVRVIHEVNGWPASFSFSVGQGMVMVTTLDAAAWLDESVTSGGDPVALAPLGEFATLLAAPRAKPPMNAQRFTDFVREQIGYTILSRGPVLAVLLLLPLSVVVSGLWLARRQKLELVGAIAACSAVLLCVVLIAMGAVQRRKVPLTVASAQWVEVAPGQNLASVKAAISIYSPEADRGPLRGEKGGVLWPDMTGQGGKQLRMVWTDLDHWSWEGMELPSGAVRAAKATHVMTMDQPAQVTLTFGPRGAEGRITAGPFEELEDLVLATPVASLAVRPDSDGVFLVEPGDQLQQGEYITGATLGQQQRARQDVYRSLLDHTDYPTSPTVLAWAQSLDLGLELSIPATQHHSALVAFPMQMTQAQPGQRVAIPSAFLPFALVRGKGNVGTTTLYNAATREWIDMVSPGHTLLFRFQLPRQVLPLTPEAATLTLDLAAADRTVEVLRVAGKQITTVAEIERPMGTQRVALDAAKLGPIDATGGLIVGVRISEATGSSHNSFWRIEAARLDLEGVVSP